MLDPLIEGMGKALRAHLAAAADSLRPVLGCTFYEQLFRIGSTAYRPFDPFVVITRDHPTLSSPRSACVIPP
ncbi:hypothetical protein [Streptomyces sp. NPDC001933]|uniref:hypothetical protein n=1 Tax=Streptomyces sp. NPDC001933 TaxID=3364626 RepID=UPI003677ED0D